MPADLGFAFFCDFLSMTKKMICSKRNDNYANDTVVQDDCGRLWFDEYPTSEQVSQNIFIFELNIIHFGKVFFVIPCVDMYEIIDMRTQTFDVPPQEVKLILQFTYKNNLS